MEYFQLWRIAVTQADEGVVYYFAEIAYNFVCLYGSH